MTIVAWRLYFWDNIKTTTITRQRKNDWEDESGKKEVEQIITVA